LTRSERTNEPGQPSACSCGMLAQLQRINENLLFTIVEMLDALLPDYGMKSVVRLFSWSDSIKCPILMPGVVHCTVLSS
jgi:hypothetical protein